MSEPMFIGLLGVFGAAFGAGWGTIWWRLGKLEARLNGSMNEWERLRNRCPLCQEEKR